MQSEMGAHEQQHPVGRKPVDLAQIDAVRDRERGEERFRDYDTGEQEDEHIDDQDRVKRHDRDASCVVPPAQKFAKPIPIDHEVPAEQHEQSCTENLVRQVLEPPVSQRQQ
ncbi:hypothetical protein D3C71_1225950 [compost metagenome]